MTKGTASMGKKTGKKTHIVCRRCGKRTYHLRKKRCSSCGYGNKTKVRKFRWQKKGSAIKRNKDKKKRK